MILHSSCSYLILLIHSDLYPCRYILYYRLVTIPHVQTRETDVTMETYGWPMDQLVNQAGLMSVGMTFGVLCATWPGQE